MASLSGRILNKSSLLNLIGQFNSTSRRQFQICQGSVPGSGKGHLECIQKLAGSQCSSNCSITAWENFRAPITIHLLHVTSYSGQPHVQHIAHAINWWQGHEWLWEILQIQEKPQIEHEMKRYKDPQGHSPHLLLK